MNRATIEVAASITNTTCSQSTDFVRTPRVVLPMRFSLPGHTRAWLGAWLPGECRERGQIRNIH